ncbi:MAG: addiction module protein, partial [Gemmataceae bacterium]
FCEASLTRGVLLSCRGNIFEMFVARLLGENLMAPTMKDLGIDHLSIADRIVLVQEIWDSIADNPEEMPLPEERKQVLDQRLAALEANPNDVLTWEEIKARIRSRE